MTTAKDHNWTNARLTRVEALYFDMLRLPSADRASALEAACPGDPELAAEVQSLLDAPESATGFLVTPVLDLAAILAVGEPGSLSGRRIGPFDVQGLLGAGGMGEVYRARDSRLGREVALKVMPPLFTSDPDRLARFEREARALASLSHPNIGALYGLEESDGVRALVLELVEGETLAERIRRPLPLSEALAIAKQIADALDAAHEKGIVHRDLKPANIMLAPDGVTKVLDFGLAKLTGAHASDPKFSKLPTATSGGTREGVVLGTAAYMSPEQARGQPVDKRTDIWAFGCILYEMLAGSPTFHRATTADTTAAILQHEPDWNALPADTPGHVRRLLAACLTKDPRLRLRDIGDAARELSGLGQRGRPSPSARQNGRRWAAFAALTIVGLLAALGFGRLNLKERALKLEMTLPPGHGMPALSPDGRLLSYVAQNGGPGSPEVLWVRPLDSLEPVMLPGTEGATLPFWSPDSRWIGFFANRKLKKIEAKGGSPVALADVTGCWGGAGGAWSRGGVIVFGSPAIHQVSESGGDATSVQELDRPLEELCHAWPSFLPDGRHFLYLGQTRPAEKRAVYLGSLDSAKRIPLLHENSRALYAAPGFVLFAKGAELMARPFDIRRLAFTGEPVPIAENVVRGGAARVSLSASDEGTLIYEFALGPALRSWSWVDRAGKTRGQIDSVRSDGMVRLSPDGKRIAFSELAIDLTRRSLWVYDIERGVKTRLTDDSSMNHYPVWSPDGSRLVFDSHASDGRQGMFERDSNGATPDRSLLRPPPGLEVKALDWSRDGKHIVFNQWRIEGGSGSEFWVLPLSGNAKPFLFLEGPLNGPEAVLSPDGRWLAYTSGESKSRQVVIRSFPDPSREMRQISTEGGASPRWRGDGQELYYLDPKGRIMAVTIGSHPKLVVGKATPLFNSPLPFPTGSVGSLQSYDVTPDGQRFLISSPPAVAPKRVIVIPDWAAGLNRD